MSSQSTENDPKTIAFKKLDNNGRNFPIWAPRCHMVLQGLELWIVVDPTASTSVRPTTPPAPSPVPTLVPTPATSTSSKLASASGSVPSPTPASRLDHTEWDRKNVRALSLLSTSIDDTPFHLISTKTTARDAWKVLSDRYNGLGALDASILSTRLHRFQLDNSKSLEPQINLMIDMRDQLVTLGDVMTDSKFAMIISESLPPSYESLKMYTVAMIKDASQLASETLITQILREEKWKENQHSMAALLARPGKSSEKATNSIPHSNPNPISKSNRPKPKNGIPLPCCTNPKCMHIGHTFE